MKKVGLVTYTRKTETFTEEFLEMGNALQQEFGDFKFILFSEAEVAIPSEANFEVQQIHMEGTKYKKILYLLEHDDSCYYLSVDNDIKADLDHLVEFARTMVERNADIGWCKIMARPKPNFVSRLVAVDKLLSHNWIRPILWKWGYGISIPGQCFMLKRATFSGKLPAVDTFLDDLALGLYVNQHFDDLKTYLSAKIVGYEQPNDSFGGLWKQRSRWAKGFSTIIDGVDEPASRRLVWIHGFSYHGLWLVNWLVMVLLAMVHPALTAVYVLLQALILTGGQVRLAGYSLLYPFVFPVFHMRWIYCIKRGKHDDKK
ncbi:glycosyltransferase family 2 protein [Neobacillus sp. Marseille-QA0830]